MIPELEKQVWDTKTLTILFNDDNEYPNYPQAKIKAVLFNNDYLDLYLDKSLNDKSETFFIEELPLSVAIKLRDFLNYAIPTK